MAGGSFTSSATWEAQELCLALDIKDSKRLLIHFFWKLSSFIFHVEVHGPFWVNFHTWCEVSIKVYFSVWVSTSSSAICEKNLHFLLWIASVSLLWVSWAHSCGFVWAPFLLHWFVCLSLCRPHSVSLRSLELRQIPPFSLFFSLLFFAFPYKC